MSVFTRTYITAELNDGTFHRVRVTARDQMQYERTARAKGWDARKDQAVSNLFIAWHGIKRSSPDANYPTFEEWQENYVLDVQVDTQDVDTETGLEIAPEPEDPTR